MLNEWQSLFEMILPSYPRLNDYCISKNTTPLLVMTWNFILCIYILNYLIFLGGTKYQHDLNIFYFSL